MGLLDYFNYNGDNTNIINSIFDKKIKKGKFFVGHTLILEKKYADGAFYTAYGDFREDWQQLSFLNCSKLLTLAENKRVVCKSRNVEQNKSPLRYEFSIDTMRYTIYFKNQKLKDFNSGLTCQCYFDSIESKCDDELDKIFEAEKESGKYNKIYKCDLVDKDYGTIYENCYILTGDNVSDLEVELTGNFFFQDCFEVANKEDVNCRIDNLNDLADFCKNKKINVPYEVYDKDVSPRIMFVGGEKDRCIDFYMRDLGWKDNIPELLAKRESPTLRKKKISKNIER